MRVLVVEDEVRMARLLARALREEGYAVDVAADGPEGLWLATENAYAAVPLDVNLSGLDGFRLCRKLRGAESWVPVLMLTAIDGVGDRSAGSTRTHMTTWSSRSACSSWPPGCGRWASGTTGRGR